MDKSQESIKQAAETFEENSDMIRISISSQVYDKSIVDDIFHNLFISLVKSPIPPNVENVKGYLRRAIRNDVIDFSIKRKCFQKREQKYAHVYSIRMGCCNPVDEIALTDQARHIFKIIEKELPSHEARALIEKFRYGRDSQEAAMAMGITRRSFSRYLCTGLKRLRCHLKQDKCGQTVTEST